MPNKYTVAIHLEGRDELTQHLRQAEKCFGALGQTARLSLAPMERWSRELEETAQVTKTSIPDTLRMAEASKVLAKAYEGQETVLQRIAPAARQAAEAGRQAVHGQAEQVESFSAKLSAAFQKVLDASEKFRKSDVIGETLSEGFNTFRKETADGLESFFSVVFKSKLDNFKPVWEKFTLQLEDAFFKMLGRIAAGMTEEVLLKPAMEWGEKALSVVGSSLKALFMAEGGLVTKPTLAVVGEAGPEVVLPLDVAGEFVKKTIVGAARETALNEAAKRAALEAGLEIGVERSAQGAAAAAGAATGVALFAMFDAVQTALGGNSAIRALGDIAFGERGPGLVQKGLGALGVRAFGGTISAEAHGLGNIWQIGNMVRDAEMVFGALGFTAQQLIDATGGNPAPASNLIREAIQGRAPLTSEPINPWHPGWAALMASGDAVGRFITGPSLRLLGERGPEHVLNVDSGPSVRALTEGLRPIVREIFEEERRASGGPARGITVNVDARGALFPDERGMERLTRMIEEKLRAFQSRRLGYAGT